MDDFEQFVLARGPGLARTAFLLCGDRQHAEDLLQESLAAVAQKWGAVVRHGDPEPYVRRIMYNRAVDSWRRRRRRPEQLEPDFSESTYPSGRGDDGEVIARRVVLQEALQRLTARQRAVLVLRFYEDHTEVETARLLGCSTSTVKSQTRLALQRLRERAPELAEMVGLRAEGAMS